MKPEMLDALLNVIPFVPTRGRGLKRASSGVAIGRRAFVPTRGRGLKPHLGVGDRPGAEFVPTRGRGLKPSNVGVEPVPVRSSPRGGAD